MEGSIVFLLLFLEYLFEFKCIYTFLFSVPRRVSRAAPIRDVYAATLYAEARGEIVEGQTWVAWVIFNRAKHNPDRIRDVCLAPWQFECWTNRDEIIIDEPEAFRKALEITGRVQKSEPWSDPTIRLDNNHCEHYNNPRLEQADWVHRARYFEDLGNHRFYWF
jgi:hypothetical protein